MIFESYIYRCYISLHIINKLSNRSILNSPLQNNFKQVNKKLLEIKSYCINILT